MTLSCGCKTDWWTWFCMTFALRVLGNWKAFDRLHKEGVENGFIYVRRITDKK
jgi:hypothetical protein